MRRRFLRLLALMSVVLLAVFAADARTGGGSSYSGGGGSSGGGGGGDGGGEIIYLIFRLLLWLTIEHPAIGIPIDIIVIVLLIRYFRETNRTSHKAPPVTFSAAVAGSTAAAGAQPMDALRKYDPNFSNITFADFCYSLYGRVHNARGEGRLEQYAPYLSAMARTALARRAQNLTSVEGVVIGSFDPGGVRGLDTPDVEVSVQFEANYTEKTGSSSQSWYVREQWTFERKRDILSPPPEKAKADHCPRCGAALKTRTDGACDYCGVKITSGAFNWYVKSVMLLAKESRGPLLTSDVPEQGTDFPSVVQPNFEQHRGAFLAAQPEFKWPEFEERVRYVALTLQKAWSSRDWEAARVLETEPLFQMHRYWIDAYKRQGLRNPVDDHQILRVQPVKVTMDAFYFALTVRIWAEGRDYTVDANGKVVAGSNSRTRRWSEYWTFIRSRSADTKDGKVACPNCGATVVVGSSGVCQYCGGKITSGAFEWILSRIEQDESYRG